MEYHGISLIKLGGLHSSGLMTWNRVCEQDKICGESVNLYIHILNMACMLHLSKTSACFSRIYLTTFLSSSGSSDVTELIASKHFQGTEVLTMPIIGIGPELRIHDSWVSGEVPMELRYLQDLGLEVVSSKLLGPDWPGAERN
jgi:hypothetical protein